MNLGRYQRAISRSIRRITINLQLPNQPKDNGWNAANIIAALSALAALISTLLTYFALQQSIEQNRISDKRYFENDSINKIEKKNNDSLNKITQKNNSRKDSIQRRNDSTNLALFQQQIEGLNKSLGYQNQNLNIQLLSNKSELSLRISYNKSPNNLYRNGVSLKPLLKINNRGRTLAYNLRIKYLIIKEYRWNNISKFTRIINEDIPLSGIEVEPDSTIEYPYLVGTGMENDVFTDSTNSTLRKTAELKLKKNYSKLELSMKGNPKTNTISSHINLFRTYFVPGVNTLYRRYPAYPYTYYLICQLTYRDKFRPGVNKTNIIKRIIPNNISIKDTTIVSVLNVGKDKLMLMRDFISKYKLDYKDFEPYTYGKSFENEEEY